MAELFWSDRASKDLDKLIDYLLEEWGIEITIRVSNEIDHTVARIKDTPDQFPVVVKSRKIHRCVVSPQTSIFFRVNKGAIEIISIFDNRQDPKKRKLYDKS